MATTAAEKWGRLDTKRQALLARCEDYAALTLPYLFTREGYDANSEELSTDYQSVGATLVNNLTNKLMLAEFAPSRPFFRISVPKDLLAKLQEDVPQFNQQRLQEELAVQEKSAVELLDQRAARPSLYSGAALLIVTGNALMILGKDSVRMLSLRHYVVQRGRDGKVINLIVKEKVLFESLDQEVQQYLTDQNAGKYTNAADRDIEVELYVWVRWDGKKFKVTQECDDVSLTPMGGEYDGVYAADACPYIPLCWTRPDGADYGVGMVESHHSDLSAVSVLSESLVKAAILASEFRWLVNPAGQTRPEDFNTSENGQALPGVKDDIQLVSSGTAAGLDVVQNINADYINRLGRSFLAGSSVVRNAERVTAEEIRLVAQDLETGLGGVYSRLAVDWQPPIARWLLSAAGIEIAGTKLEVTIITGLEALSRNGDLDNVKAFLADVTSVSALPPEVSAALKLDAIFSALASGRGLKAGDFVFSPEEQAANRQRAQNAAMQQEAGTAAVNAAAQQATQQPGN